VVTASNLLLLATKGGFGLLFVGLAKRLELECLYQYARSGEPIMHA